MNRKSRFLLLLVVLSAALACYHVILHPAVALAPVSPVRTLSSRVVLVPLDSRPPCRQHVVDLGRIAGLDVVTPPAECMDYYSQPGDTKAMQDWLITAVQPGDAVIVSMDQLLYGGLLAAREKQTPEAQQDARLSYLRAFRTAHPGIPIYAQSTAMTSAAPSSLTHASSVERPLASPSTKRSFRACAPRFPTKASRRMKATFTKTPC